MCFIISSLIKFYLATNDFENMLGETANIRCANIPYFQIFIIPDKLPYYKNDGTIQKWEEFTVHNSEKYLTLSRDDIQTSIHTTTKTLLYVVHLPDISLRITSTIWELFSSVIFNNYEDFAEKVVHYIKFI